ncbi:MAG: hypothetical protein IKB51_00215 [Clostridia bacterium]|nr:hypothetical protein [Clostridia bacterium]
MKRLALILLLALAVVSCGEKTDGDPFSVFSGDFTARILMTCEGNQSEYVYRSEDKTISFLSPTELTGYVMRSENGEVRLCYGDISVALSEYESRLMLVNETVFGMSPESISSISAEQGETGTVTSVRTLECSYRFASDGKPILISGSIDGIAFEMVFSEFSEEAQG